MDQWLGRHTGSARVRALAEAITRVSTYTAEMPYLSAGAALTQIQLAIRQGVLYLDGGWQTIIDSLARRAQGLGVEIRRGESLDSLRHIDASGVILAVPPKAIEKLTGARLPVLRPVRMATLDLGLRSLPAGAARFALGMDRPLYLWLHSAAARLAPAGAALVHVGKYLNQGESDANSIRAELEHHADLCRLPTACWGRARTPRTSCRKPTCAGTRRAMKRCAPPNRSSPPWSRGSLSIR